MQAKFSNHGVFMGISTRIERQIFVKKFHHLWYKKTDSLRSAFDFNGR